MAEDIFKPSGITKARKPDAGGGIIRSVPVLGIVKNNVDPTRAGRIQVYISDLGGADPDDSNNWATVSYMTPFFGSIKPTSPSEGFGDFVANPASYGMWYSPPDINSTVICIFINGDPNFGFYIGSVPKPEALTMVPAIGSSENVITNNNAEAQSYGGATLLPVTNINTNNTETSNDNNFLKLPKPIHSFQAAILFKQGLLRDRLRGTISSSANRESPSRVGWGVSTPGRPIYEGGFTDSTIVDAAGNPNQQSGLKVISRRGGHSIVMDDGDLIGRDNLVRLRSSAGHQILMSDDGQTIFIIHSNGQSWVELGKEGTIDMFSTNSFNVRTQGDINFHADNNINLHAKKKLNIKAEDIFVQSEKATSHNIGTDYKIETGGKHSHKIASSLTLQAGGTGTVKSSGMMYINGSKVYLNTSAGTNAESVPPLQDIGQTDTLFEGQKGYIAAPGILKTITSRTPAHSPWVNANQGVNVDTSPNADDNLPIAPNMDIIKAAQRAETTTSATALNSSVLATVPSVPRVSSSIDKTSTGALLGAISTNAASGPAQQAVKTGSGLVATNSGPVAALGSFAQSPLQIESAGFLKPGASTLINSLVSNGKPLTEAMSKVLFTGKDGVTDISAFANNPVAQVSSVVTNLQKSQTSLTNAGLLTGKESPMAIAGLVMSGVTNGVKNTLDTVKNIAGNITQLPSAGITGVNGSVLNALNSGNFAAGLAQSSSGGMGSILGAVTAMGISSILGNKNRGAAALAVSAIAASLPNLPSKKPVNLRTLEIEGDAIAEAKSLKVTDPFKNAKDLLRLTGRLGGTQINRTTNALIGGLDSVNRFNNARTPDQALKGLTSIIGSVGRIGTVTGNRSLGRSANRVNTVINASNQINRALNTISNSKTIVGQLGGLGRILGTVGQVGAVFGRKNLVRNTRRTGILVSSSQGILRGIDRIATSKNINTTLGALNSIIRNSSRIRATTGNRSRAGGMSRLPGGTLSIGSVVNKSLGKLGLPRNPALSSIITNAVTAAINNIAYPKAAGGANGLPRAITSPSNIAGSIGFDGLNGIQQSITKSLSDLQAFGKNLTTLSITDLNAGDAAQLTAATRSIGFGGADAIKMPVIAESTYDVSSMDSSVDALLGDPRIPRPIYGEEIDSSRLSALEKVLQENNTVDVEFNSLEALLDQVEIAKEEYYLLEASLPAGSIEVTEAKDNWLQLQIRATVLLDSIENKIN